MTLDAKAAYRQNEAQGASPVHLVVLLYDQLMEDLRAAIAALRRNDIEQRTKELDHALLVVGHLHDRLNMEGGGEVARNLKQFYNVLRASLLQAQAQASVEILRQQLENLLKVREAWLEVERCSAAVERAGSPATSQAEKSAQPKPRSDWRV